MPRHMHRQAALLLRRAGYLVDHCLGSRTANRLSGCRADCRSPLPPSSADGAASETTDGMGEAPRPDLNTSCGRFGDRCGEWQPDNSVRSSAGSWSLPVDGRARRMSGAGPVGDLWLALGRIVRRPRPARGRSASPTSVLGSQSIPGSRRNGDRHARSDADPAFLVPSWRPWGRRSGS